MSTPAQVGKSEYNAALARAREANSETRKHLRHMLQETSSNVIRALVVSILLEIGENDEAIHRLDEIGRTLKT